MSSPRAAGRGSLGLGPFLNELESRLRTLSAQEMSAALLAHAECLPARERTSFLAVFTPVEPSSGGGEASRGATVAVASAADEMLLAVQASRHGPSRAQYVRHFARQRQRSERT